MGPDYWSVCWQPQVDIMLKDSKLKVNWFNLDRFVCGLNGGIWMQGKCDYRVINPMWRE